MMISFSSFFAVALLTNCALMSVVVYLPLAAAVSIIPLSKFRKGTFFAGAVLLFLLLHRGLIVWGYDPLIYVQADLDVAISSTISSPTYGEKQIDYWRRYEYKTPTVIAIRRYKNLNRNTYLTMFEWIEENYEWVGDGIWWSFYRIRE